jgi:uncharacterized membrane protein YdjX (TVP38/TMEM64 family)
VTHHPFHLKRLLVLVALVLAVVAIARSEALQQAVVGVLEASRELMSAYPRGGMLLFLLLSALSATLSFFSSGALVPIGVYVWGPEATALLLFSGGTLGGVSGYWIARTVGRKVVHIMFAEDSLHRYEEFFRHGARWRTILLFRIALQSEIPSYVLGVLKYPFSRYVPIILLGELPYVLVMVYLGEVFLERNVPLFVGVLVFALGLTYWAWRRLQAEMHASEAAHHPPPGPAAATGPAPRR